MESNGHLVCSECGLVSDDRVLRGYTWEHHPRDSDQAPSFDIHCHSSRAKVVLLRRHYYRYQNVYAALRTCERLVTVLGVSLVILDRANYLIRKQYKGVRRHSCSTSLVAEACLWQAIREKPEICGITLEQLATAVHDTINTRAKPKHILHAWSQLSFGHQGSARAPRLPKDLLLHVINRVFEDPKIQRVLERHVENQGEYRKFITERSSEILSGVPPAYRIGKSPWAIAGGAVYLAATESDEERKIITQAICANATKMSELTIRFHYRDLSEMQKGIS